MNRLDISKRAKRLLYLFDQLERGNEIDKQQIVDRAGVTERTIERDIKIIKEYLQDPSNSAEIKNKNGNYSLAGVEERGLSKKQLLALAKLLVGSRAFSESETEALLKNLDDLYALYSDKTGAQKTKIKKAIQNELFNYQGVQAEIEIEGQMTDDIFAEEESNSLVEKIWDFTKAVEEKRIIKFDYKKEKRKNPEVKKVKPAGVIFSEHYFYLVAYPEKEKFIFRLDRVKDYKLGDRGSFKINYKDRFEEGEFKNKTPYMIAGETYRLKFRYFGPSLSAVVNKFPSTEKIIEKEDYYLIEAKVNGGFGVKMFLMSQMNYIEVIAPKKLREDIKETIEKMQDIYQERN